MSQINRNKGMGEHFVDPRSGSFETTPIKISGNVQEPVLDAGGCVVDPRYSKNDCWAKTVQEQRGLIFPWEPLPGSKGFCQTGYVSVPGGGYGGGGATLCSIVIPDAHVGKLKEFGFAVANHSTNFASITIKLLISDLADPLMSQNAFFESTFQNRVPYYAEIPAGKTLSLVAFNFSGGALNVGGILVGWAEPFFQ
jgi:hypothetical protein